MTLMTKTNPNWLPNFLEEIFEDNLSNNRLGKKSTLPAVNIVEMDDHYSLHLAAPGKTKEDFKLELDNDLLHISAEMKTENTTEKKQFTRKEFSYENFKRSFTLPESIDTSQIKAQYNHGILEVRLPKREEAKTQPKRLIDIQ